MLFKCKYKTLFDSDCSVFVTWKRCPPFSGWFQISQRSHESNFSLQVFSTTVIIESLIYCHVKNIIVFNVLLNLLHVKLHLSSHPPSDLLAPVFLLQVKGEDWNSTVLTSSSTPCPHPPLLGTPSPISPTPWNLWQTRHTRTFHLGRHILTSIQPYLQVCVNIK